MSRKKNKYNRRNVVINVSGPTLSLLISEPPQLQPDYTHLHTRYERYWAWHLQPSPSSSSELTPSLVAVPQILDSTGHRAEKGAGRGLTIVAHSVDVSNLFATKREKFARTNLLVVSLLM